MISIILFLAILLFSITFHEYCHGWAANKLGDPTPKDSGRLTLNPLAHIDTFGTVLLPIFLLILSRGTFAIGYAKPVPINPNHFKNPKKDIKWIGLSGPLANIFLALILIVLIKLNFPLKNILILGAFLNLILAVFNLIPIPPLDGSRIITSFLPANLTRQYLRIEPYGFFIIIFLVFIGFFRWAIIPIITFIFSLFNIQIAL
ncbi:MAG: site-2 protease family protein [Candidatus Omnitrophica bacterium]|nr:site-2 protease family protein [Candidatus Omnitrophota bacterium]MCF7891355.1 site-2 protease family protein [Candidatus Omnitrophota bacterium]MCF7898238.1 site-2 protease family protein [Candidatus Omnitrophota bacterium]MCF7909061.1 site-2 protease family protein [Candidatus Omnitrophota bacterium]